MALSLTHVASGAGLRPGVPATQLRLYPGAVAAGSYLAINAGYYIGSSLASTPGAINDSAGNAYSARITPSAGTTGLRQVICSGRVQTPLTASDYIILVSSLYTATDVPWAAGSVYRLDGEDDDFIITGANGFQSNSTSMTVGPVTAAGDTVLLGMDCLEYAAASGPRSSYSRDAAYPNAGVSQSYGNTDPALAAHLYWEPYARILGASDSGSYQVASSAAPAVNTWRATLLAFSPVIRGVTRLARHPVSRELYRARVSCDMPEINRRPQGTLAVDRYRNESGWIGVGASNPAQGTNKVTCASLGIRKNGSLDLLFTQRGDLKHTRLRAVTGSYSVPTTLASGYDHVTHVLDEGRGLLVACVYKKSEGKWYVITGELSDDGETFTVNPPVFLRTGYNTCGSLTRSKAGVFEFAYVTAIEASTFQDLVIRCRKLNSDGTGSWT